MGLEKIISKLGLSKKETIYLSVTPSVGLELIQLNVQNKIIKNYGYKPLHYNESLREFGDMDTFKEVVSELFEEMKINIKCNVVLNIPMVLLGSKELPVLLGDEAVGEALTSEAEQSYIFKRYDPVVSWVDVSNLTSASENRKLYYSAIQKNVIEDVKTALQELGITLVDIQLSMMSLLRALKYSGFLNEQTKDGISWDLMLVTSNGYSITSMIGENIIDYYEEPLAIKSFDGEELYSAISASAQIALMSYPANYLVIVSETDLLSSELLSSRLSFDGKISFYENNDFKKYDLVQVSLEVLEEKAHKISLEAIGNAVSSVVSLPLEFNFFGTGAGARRGDDSDEPVHLNLAGYEFDISPNGAKNLAIIFSVLIVIPFLILFITMPMVKKQKQAQLDELQGKLDQTIAQVKSLENEQNKYNDFDVNSTVKKTISSNRTKLMGYIAIGESVPKQLWLTYFVAQGDGKFDIKGKATNVQDVYTFYSNMKESLINVPLRLQQLDMETQSVDDAVELSGQDATYLFEITNMSAADLNPTNAAQDSNENANSDKTNANGDKTNEKNNQQNDNSLLNKPLLNFGKGN